MLFFYTACRYAADNVLGKKKVNDDNGEDRERDHCVDLAHIKGLPVGVTQLCEQNRKGFLHLAADDQVRCEVVIPACHECENGLNRDRRDDQRNVGVLYANHFHGICRDYLVHCPAG